MNSAKISVRLSPKDPRSGSFGALRKTIYINNRLRLRGPHSGTWGDNASQIGWITGIYLDSDARSGLSTDPIEMLPSLDRCVLLTAETGHESPAENEAPSLQTP